jgi:hypothetical protein
MTTSALLSLMKSRFALQISLYTFHCSSPAISSIFFLHVGIRYIRNNYYHHHHHKNIASNGGGAKKIIRGRQNKYEGNNN